MNLLALPLLHFYLDSNDESGLFSTQRFAMVAHPYAGFLCSVNNEKYDITAV